MHTFVQPFCDTPLDDEDVGRTVILNLVCRAQRIVRIMTPYLVLDEAVETALCTAAKSGIQVQVITPGIGDKWYVHMLTRGGYGPLLRAGVEVYEYTPGFIHSKVCAADGQCGVVGTVNLDYRSLYLHFENAVWLYGDAVEQLDADFNQTLPKCTRITLEAYESTPMPVRFFRAVLRIIAPMM